MAKYFEALEHAIQDIKVRFEQTDRSTFRVVQSLLLKQLQDEGIDAELEDVTRMYSDLDRDGLKTQLAILSAGNEVQVESVSELIRFLQESDSDMKFLPQAQYLAKLLLVMPATNAVSERNFSALKRVKTYLRSTTTDQRLNNVMTLHVHKDETDKLNLVDIADEFCSKLENRKQMFGNVTVADIACKGSLVSVSSQIVAFENLE